MKKKMLQFVDVRKETPQKRDTDKRKGDFNENIFIKNICNEIEEICDAASTFIGKIV